MKSATENETTMDKQYSEASIVDFHGVLAAKMPFIRYIITLVFGRIMSI